MNKALTIITLAITTLIITHCAQRDTFYSNVMRSDLYYQAYDDHKYDFLWVIDNSSSMTDKVNYVRDNLQGFLNTINSRKAIDFQMAVVTTDFFTDGGALVASPTGQKVVKSATSTNPVAEFAAIVNSIDVDTATSFWEQGLESAYKAIELHGTEFLRPGVPTILIFISDEDDFSCKGNCFGVEPEHNANFQVFSPSRYINYFKTIKKSESTDVSMFPIVGIPTSSCQVASMGVRYIKVMDGLKTTGVYGSVCNSELAQTYKNIAATLADRGVRFKLTSAASDKGINVFVDDKLVAASPDNYVYEKSSNSIVFTGAVPSKGSTIAVTYNQDTK